VNYLAGTQLGTDILSGIAIKKKFYLLLAIGIFLALVWPMHLRAAILPNPNPDVYGDDLQDLGYFVHQDQVFFSEVFDVGPFLGAQGSEFGFFFSGTDINDPTNLIPIFDSSDIGVLSRLALVDFSTGIVFDLDENSVQNTFSGSGDIGFYISLDPSLGVPTFFTDPALNIYGLDLGGTFPSLETDDNQFLLTFQFPNDSGGYDPIVFESIDGVDPVPLPGTLLLFGSGLAGMFWYSRKRYLLQSSRQNQPQ
jgi:hypothetical protein